MAVEVVVDTTMDHHLDITEVEEEATMVEVAVAMTVEDVDLVLAVPNGDAMHPVRDIEETELGCIDFCHSNFLTR